MIFQLECGFPQREQEHCALEEEVLTDFSICASSSGVPKNFCLQKSDLPQGDPHTLFDVSSTIKRFKAYNLTSSNARIDRIGPVVAFRGNL